MKKTIQIVLIVPLLASLLSVQGAVSAPIIDWQSKVDVQVLQDSAEGETEFLIFLGQQADLRQAANIKAKNDKGKFAYEQLTSIARRTQEPIIRLLEAHRAEYQPYWVTNMIWVRGSAQLVEILARRSDVSRLYDNPSIQMDFPLEQDRNDTSRQTTPADVSTIEWNITQVGAPQVWATGYNGQGAVIGGQDTGYHWEHPALKDKYRGWDSNTATASHDYNWHDAIHQDNPNSTPGNPCGFDSVEPCDDGYHGTHTMGTIVGDDGGVNQIGMAPGAEWVGCRNMEQGWGTPTTYSECYQWFIAPWPVGGDPLTDGDPSKAPDVINNSWSCPEREGCTEPEVLLTAVQNVRAAGIVTVHSAGNAGSSCPTSTFFSMTPAAIYDESFTVGSTDQNDIINTFSSRGPVTMDGSNRLKPDITAPGSDILSSYPPNTYAVLNGTSMAAPHVAGLVALLISAQPSLAGQVDLIEALITRNALPRTTSQTCGGVPGSQVPNNTYGWGRIDALASVQNALTPFDIHKSPSATWLKSGETITYTIQITQNYPLEMTSIVISDVLPANVDFIDASTPYTLVGDTLQWSLPSLDANTSHNVQLIVEAPGDGLWTIVNQDYGVHSAEAPGITPGSPISVTVATDILYLPILTNSP